MTIAAVMSFVFLQTVTVFAAGNTNTISLKLAEYKKDSRCAKIHCKMQIKDEVTNGKLRITYDDKQIKLLSSESGEGIGNGMCEINECLTGNKKEGEIVVAFASADALPKEGNLLELTFELEKSVKDKDPVQVELKIEKLANQDTEVEATGDSLTFTAENGEIEDSDNNQEQNDDSEEESKENDIQGDKNHQNGTASKPKRVKTGDNTGIFSLVVAGGTAIAIAAGCIISKKIKK